MLALRPRLVIRAGRHLVGVEGLRNLIPARPCLQRVVDLAMRLVGPGQVLGGGQQLEVLGGAQRLRRRGAVLGRVVLAAPSAPRGPAPGGDASSVRGSARLRRACRARSASTPGCRSAAGMSAARCAGMGWSSRAVLPVVRMGDQGPPDAFPRTWGPVLQRGPGANWGAQSALDSAGSKWSAADLRLRMRRLRQTAGGTSADGRIPRTWADGPWLAGRAGHAGAGGLEGRARVGCGPAGRLTCGRQPARADRLGVHGRRAARPPSDDRCRARRSGGLPSTAWFCGTSI